MNNVDIYLKQKLKMQDNGKRYFSLKEICEDFGFSFDNALISVSSVLEKIKALGFYVGNMMSFVRNEFREIEDISLSSEALMLVAADINKSGLTKNSCWKQIANEIYISTDKFYAEKRFFSRQRYSELSAQLNGILGSLSYVKAKGFAKCFQEIYTIILSNYFRVDTKKELYKRKHLTDGQNYLDYISKVELDDLSWVVKNLTLFIMNNPYYNDILNVAQEFAKNASDKFIKNFNRTPVERPAHFDKPKAMLKNFTKLLEYYGLSQEEKKNANEI